MDGGREGGPQAVGVAGQAVLGAGAFGDDAVREEGGSLVALEVLGFDVIFVFVSARFVVAVLVWGFFLVAIEELWPEGEGEGVADHGVDEEVALGFGNHIGAVIDGAEDTGGIE